MDKYPVYPGSIPLDTNVLSPQRATEIALGFMLQATFGTGTKVDGLACTPTAPASMSVVVGPGSIIYATTVDTLGTGFGSLPVDNSTALVKIGVNAAATTMSALTAPGTAGQSQNYLIQTSFTEADGGPVVLPFYNSSNPTVPYLGPSGSGAPSNTVRTNRVNLQIKAGSPATTGSQTTPAPDSGFVGVWVVTVPFGATSLTSANISAYGSAPFIPQKLGTSFTPGWSNWQVFTSSGSFTVPTGITRVWFSVWGGGAGGQSSGTAPSSVSGGPGGGYFETIATVTPGSAISVTVAGQAAIGAAGATSSFGSLGSATGGHTNGTPGTGSGASNTSTISVPGNLAGLGTITGGISFGGWGGGAWGTANTGQSIASIAATGQAPNFPGGGGGGGINSGLGNVGGAGLVIVRW